MALNLLLRCLMLTAVAMSALMGICSAAGGWTQARATWFDIGPDLSRANCHFSWVPTGRNVGAWPDPQDGFESSCGKCYEVKCRNADLVDGYGNSLKRSNACFDESKSVIITIADACPCRYPNNEYSNKRWCCGDMNHLDVSQEVFQQLADLNQGVIGLAYREVDCSATASSGNGGDGSSSYSSGGGSDTNGDGNSGGSQYPQQQSYQQSQPTQQHTKHGWWGGWRR